MKKYLTLIFLCFLISSSFGQVRIDSLKVDMKIYLDSIDRMPFFEGLNDSNQVTWDQLSPAVKQQVGSDVVGNPPDDVTLELKISGPDTTLGIKTEGVLGTALSESAKDTVEEIFEHLGTGMVNAAHWGITGNGIADDTDELQLAFEAMENNGVFWCIDQTILVSDTLSIKYPGIYYFTNTTINVDTSAFPSSLNVFYIRSGDVEMRDLTINGKYGTTRGVYLVGGNDNITLDNLTLTATGQAIRFDGTSNSNVRNCVISDTSAGSSGIYILVDGGVNTDNYIQDNWILSNEGIDVQRNTPNLVQNRRFWITGNQMYFPANNYLANGDTNNVNTVGITYTVNSDAIIADNFISDFESPTQSFHLGISVTGDTTGRGGYTIKNNHVYWSKTTPLELYEVTNALVDGNIFYSSAGTNFFRNASDIIISNNFFRADTIGMRIGTTPTTRAMFMRGALAPTQFEEQTGNLRNITVTNNQITGYAYGLYISGVADSSVSNVIFANNQIDSTEIAVLLSGSGTDFNNVSVNNNVAGYLLNSFFVGPPVMEELSLSNNIIYIDTTGKSDIAELSNRAGVVTLQGVNRLTMNNNYMMANSDKNYPLSTSKIVKYGTIQGNIFEAFGSDNIGPYLGRVDTTGNVWVYRLPIQDDLLGWWAAEDIEGVDEDSISTWDSRVASNTMYTYMDSAATRPVLKTGVVNGQAALRFDGTNDIMKASTTVLSTAAKRTVFLVLANADTTGIDGIFGSMRRSTHWGNGLSFGELDTLVVTSVNNSGTDGPVLKAPFSTDPAIVTYHLENNNTKLRLNGSQIAVNTDSTLQAAYALTTLGGKDHNAATPTPGNYYQGDVLEIIVYNAVFDTTNFSIVETYLNEKYSIY